MRDYSYKDLIDRFQGDLHLPLAFLDQKALDENIQAIKIRAQGMPIRIATKSLRCRWAIDYIREQLGDQQSGLMCYHPREAVWLCQHGHDNILVAYPYFQDADLKAVAELSAQGKNIYLMVDNLQQLHLLEESAKKWGKFNLCLDLDMSTHFGALYFGVYRSSLREEKALVEMLGFMATSKHLQLKGAMGYEAQIAGVGGSNPHQKVLNWPIRFLQSISMKRLKKRRMKLVRAIYNEGFKLDFVNGGGTGSVEQTIQDPSVSEVAVGSGFYSPGLFDYYQHFQHRPAAGFALEVTRNPYKGVYTCAGGGYVASGSVSRDKLPTPMYPSGMKLFANEGVGEVQTPVAIGSRQKLKIGDAVFFRHSKAGELCERFNQLTLLKSQGGTQQIATYRGEGQCFL